ncbi:DUF2970 domain-containing protein [Shewanella carassii]|uniref:DUF2970 domain-containing protein n=1 Tax=Shewanella carassii TaxID=1987584 RepID=A0ABQ1TDP2_9GAMM|nr:DUF2970 domain-containing protein [Shewanella carassii]BCV64895.1 hypothetical protein TUM17387_02540 [Shewanella carassii]GGE90558.1 hypothetical protein GCM10011520_33700 [Shewanella carassii]
MLGRYWRYLYSTLAAFFGVQSESNRLKDFSSHSSPLPYIITGVLLAALLVLGLLLLVNRVLA